MDLLDALTQTFDHATKVISGVHDDQLDLATPCPQWEMRTLLAHTIGVVANIGRSAGSQPLLADTNAYSLDADRGAQFRAEADRTLAVWKARGLEGEIHLAAGTVPAEAGLGINLLDTATHTWDIARASGQDGSLPDEVAVMALAVSRQVITDALRLSGRFQPAVAVGSDASPTDQLVAFLGRQP